MARLRNEELESELVRYKLLYEQSLFCNLLCMTDHDLTQIRGSYAPERGCAVVTPRIEGKLQ